MVDESYNFDQARVRLEEIVSQVRKKDTSLERSLDLLEEGVRLANSCTELVDHTEWRSVAAEAAGDAADAAEAPEPAADTDVPGQPDGDAGTSAAAEQLGDEAAESTAPAAHVYDYEAEESGSGDVSGDEDASGDAEGDSPDSPNDTGR